MTKTILTLVMAAFLFAPVLAEEAFHGSLLDGAKSALIKTGGGKADVTTLTCKKYLFLYFSAHWCQPCRLFTPKLVDFYNTNFGNGDFDLLFVSGDEDQQSMNKYMVEAKMPWVGLKVGNKQTEKLKEKYGVRVIPCLVLLNERDEVLATSYLGEKFVGPWVALKKYGTLHAASKTQGQGEVP